MSPYAARRILLAVGVPSFQVAKILAGKVTVSDDMIASIVEARMPQTQSRKD